jgi:O-acetyl-ADP-ribose deacetylase (regulator of RNase III)
MSYHITCKQGNLLEENDATFIVNASNTKLILGSGVSMAFKRHCGIELQKEMYDKVEAMKSEGTSIMQGDAIITSSAHASNFKYAIHVAVMDYSSRERPMPTLTTIYECLKNIQLYLKWYSQSHSEMKLVLPLLGCGVGGLDKQQVIQTYKMFFEHHIDFECEVVIYGHSAEDYHLLQETLT